MDAAAASAAPDLLEQTVELLLAPPSQPPRDVQRALPGVLRTLAAVIAVTRDEQERLAGDLSRTDLASSLKDLHDDFQRIASCLQLLQSHPLLRKLLRGDEGIFDALGRDVQLEHLRLAAERAANWQKRMFGPGRHTVADILDWPRPELLTANALVGLYLLLCRQPPNGESERDRQACEQLWVLSGASPSNSIGRWKNFIAIARKQKAARKGALQEAHSTIDPILRGEMYAKVLREGTVNKT